jgi:hypothetical protein
MGQTKLRSGLQTHYSVRFFPMFLWVSEVSSGLPDFLCQ